MTDSARRPEQSSPKSSPRGSRSPAYPTGTLKTTITLGKNPTVLQTGPFYLMKDPPEQSDRTGSSNLMAHNNLEHSYNKFCGKKVKEELSAFLPNLPGNIDNPGLQDNSSLRSVIEKPPIVGKELILLSSMQLSGFRLHPGPLPEQYKLLSQAPQKKKHKKKHKKESGKEGQQQENQDNASDSGHDLHKKSKKAKRSDEEREKKKRKKEKKKKKEKDKEGPN